MTALDKFLALSPATQPRDPHTKRWVASGQAGIAETRKTAEGLRGRSVLVRSDHSGNHRGLLRDIVDNEAVVQKATGKVKRIRLGDIQSITPG